MIKQVFGLLVIYAQYGARANEAGPATWTFFAKNCDNCARSEEIA